RLQVQAGLRRDLRGGRRGLHPATARACGGRGRGFGTARFDAGRCHRGGRRAFGGRGGAARRRRLTGGEIFTSRLGRHRRGPVRGRGGRRRLGGRRRGSRRRRRGRGQEAGDVVVGLGDHADQ